MICRIAVAAALLTSPIHAEGYAVGDTFDDPMLIAQEAFAGFPPGEEGRPGVAVEVSTDFFGQMTILVAQAGFADDSVAGQRDQYVLSQLNGVWTMTFTLTQYLCRRGANTVTWQTDLCP
ncbi:hypothetical protein [Gymnodinialimonas ulvae]|uniref:hypothetical protein n=1 Tax=Gymnodinialimonas ulvae TaxID=3126504 RepID=UPI0030A7BBEB